MRRVANKKLRFNDPHGLINPKIPKLLPVKNIVQKTERPLPTQINPGQRNDIYKNVSNFLNSDSNYYLGFGGMGDALLVLAACWNDPKSRVIFFANSTSLTFISEIFNLFNIGLYIFDNIMGQSIAGTVFDLVTRHKNFKTSGHLADGLFHGDWLNENKYISRIINYVPWIDKLGKTSQNPIIVCPSGSSKDHNRQRYITSEECRKLVNKYLYKNETVYINISLADFRQYWYPNLNCYSLSSNVIRDWQGKEEKINLKKMLQIINSAKEVISVDTWLKSYSLLNHIPTTVIETRWNGYYKRFGEDITDWIFLNPKIWPNIKFARIENLL